MINIKKEIFTSVARTFLLASFKSFFLILILNQNTFSKALTFGKNDEIQVLSEKAYRKSSENSFEAQGNVIIKLGKDAIYGDKASLSFATGYGKVQGNVRYVGPLLTMYGTEINYNLKDKSMSVYNAKVVDKNFTILGRSIQRLNSGEILAKEAEYTTCKDCPESWSIQGLDVRIVPNEYIYMKHAFVKVKGVTIIYLPYIVLPIKKDRESGLLFPRFGFDFERGFYFKQPFFWAINDSNDLTLEPTSYGQRAYGGEYEFRRAINSDSDFSFFNMQALDRIWEAEKLNDDLKSDRNLRQYYEYDLFYKSSNNFSLFSYGKYLSDLDILADYDVYLKDKLLDNETGHDFGFLYNFSALSFSVDASFKNDNFYHNAKGFDDSYVQNLPHVEIQHSPLTILENVGPITKLSFWQSLKYDNFKQNHREELTYIRNIERFDYTPTLNLVLDPLGPVNIETSYQYDHQLYQVNSKDEKTANKYGHFFKTRLWVDIEKTFGKAYIEKVIRPKVNTSKSDGELISSVPQVDQGNFEDKIYHSSYKNLITYNLNHLFYEKQKFSGNTRLVEQFSDSASESKFDDRDIVKGANNNLSDLATRTDIPESNTLELKIDSSVIRKTPRENSNIYQNFKYNLDNYSFFKIFDFSISQGVILDEDDPDSTFKDKLTRLASSFSLYINDFDITASEYYFHQSGDHITSINLSHKLKVIEYSVGYLYDSFLSQNRYSTFAFTFHLSDLLSLRTGQYYDLDEKRVYESYVGGLYSPTNNCWKFDFEYRQKDTIENNQREKDRILSINFLLNYNAKNFNSLLGLSL